MSLLFFKFGITFSGDHDQSIETAIKEANFLSNAIIRSLQEHEHCKDYQISKERYKNFQENINKYEAIVTSHHLMIKQGISYPSYLKLLFKIIFGI